MSNARNLPRIPRGPLPRRFDEGSLIEWLKIRLGEPLIDVELAVESYRQAIADAFEAFSRLIPYQGKVVVSVNSAQQQYRLPYVGHGVTGVQYKPFGFSGGVPPLTMNLGDGIVFASAGPIGSYSAGGSRMMGGIDQMYETAVYNEMSRRIIGIDFQWTVDKEFLYIQNLPATATQLVLLYDDDHDYETLPVQDQDWVRKYALAVSKIQLGEARTKYPIVGPAGQPMIQRAADLLQEGRQEEEALLGQLQLRARPLPPTYDDLPYQ